MFISVAITRKNLLPKEIENFPGKIANREHKVTGGMIPYPWIHPMNSDFPSARFHRKRLFPLALGVAQITYRLSGVHTAPP